MRTKKNVLIQCSAVQSTVVKVAKVTYDGKGEAISIKHYCIQGFDPVWLLFVFTSAMHNVHVNVIGA